MNLHVSHRAWIDPDESWSSSWAWLVPCGLSWWTGCHGLMAIFALAGRLRLFPLLPCHAPAGWPGPAPWAGGLRLRGRPAGSPCARCLPHVCSSLACRHPRECAQARSPREGTARGCGVREPRINQGATNSSSSAFLCCTLLHVCVSAVTTVIVRIPTFSESPFPTHHSRCPGTRGHYPGVFPLNSTPAKGIVMGPEHLPGGRRALLPQRPWEVTLDLECSGVAEGEQGRDLQGNAVEVFFTQNTPTPHRTGAEIKEKSRPQPRHPRDSLDTFCLFGVCGQT